MKKTKIEGEKGKSYHSTRLIIKERPPAKGINRVSSFSAFFFVPQSK
jgi:hypothetical protein